MFLMRFCPDSSSQLISSLYSFSSLPGFTCPVLASWEFSPNVMPSYPVETLAPKRTSLWKPIQK